MNPYKMLDEYLDRLAKATDEVARSVEFQRYLDKLALFHHYSWGNVILISIQRPDATHVASIRTWNRLGRRVRKGEKGIAILVPVVVKKETEEGEVEEVVRFKTGYVFDISQTEGEPLNHLQWWSDGGAPSELLRAIRAAIAADGIKLGEVDALPKGALGVSCGGLIKIVRGGSPLRTASILIHEWAHELQRRAPDWNEMPRDQKEVEVEAAAYVVLRHFGLEAAGAATYIALWRRDRDALMRSLDRIRSFAAQMIEAVEKQSEACKPQASPLHPAQRPRPGASPGGMTGGAVLTAPRHSGRGAAAIMLPGHPQEVCDG